MQDLRAARHHGTLTAHAQRGGPCFETRINMTQPDMIVNGMMNEMKLEGEGFGARQTPFPPPPSIPLLHENSVEQGGAETDFTLCSPLTFSFLLPPSRRGPR